ncbi:MAG: class I SAM-dependent methyltransferase [bacterium]
MKEFQEADQLKFWAANDVLFKGDIVSDVTLSLSEKYIGNNVVDVGAGSGALLKNFKNRYNSNKEIVAIDLVPKSEFVKNGNCTNLSFEKNSFDTFFCTDVIEHLIDEDLNKCLTEANRVLKKKGYGIFTTVNNENLRDFIVYCPQCGCTFHRWGHCQVFDEARIKNLFQNKGFVIVELRKINLKFIAVFKSFARIFYFLKVDKLLNKILEDSFFEKDLFIVVKKVREL